jgi:non-ribosomal peptide synthetase component F
VFSDLILETTDRSLAFAPHAGCSIPDETRAQLLAWGRNAQAHPEFRVHTLFEAQSVRVPDAVAATSACLQITYDALNRLANHLAQHL